MQMKTIYSFLVSLVFFIPAGSAQLKLSGLILEQDGITPVPNAIVSNLSTAEDFFAGVDGTVSFEYESLPVTIKVSALSYKTQTISVQELPFKILLENDPMMLETIVVSDFQKEQKLLRTQNAITIISNPIQKSQEGIEGLLQQIPGVYTDGSLGEVYTRVYTRGISASAEDDIGWYYQSLQEDGLPLTAIQYNYFTPDFFQRTDLMTSRLEAIRGGKSGILFQNAPGGAFNFISKSPFSEATEIKSTVGLLGEGNPYYRVDAYTSLPLGDKSLAASVGGFYRYDRGHRNTDYAWNRGGQLKAKVSKSFDKGVLTVIGKYLNDHVNRHTGLAAENWTDPRAAFGQDFNTTALMLPKLRSQIPGSPAYDYNSANGIHLNEASIQSQLDMNLNDWTIKMNGKFSLKSSDWNTSFANQPLGLESFLPYFLSGGQFPFGAVSFSDTQTKETLAIVNNAGALNAFQGQAPTFEYIQGSLPNDALMGIAPWKKLDELNETMIRVGISKPIKNHALHFGAFASKSSLDYFTNASFAYATFEPNPRLLEASLTSFEGQSFALSDAAGMTNYGGLFFESGTFDVSQYSFFANDNVVLADKVVADIGFRYENVHHKGSMDVPAPFEQEGGLDMNPITDYDNGRLTASGLQQPLDFNYDYLSFSTALSYEISESQNLHARYSKSNKAPELNTYIQNFSGLPIDERGEVQNISQLEASYRFQTSSLALSITGFSSQLKNIGVSDFVFDQQTNEIYYAPIQLNSTSTSGIELEWFLTLSNRLSVSGSQTFQSSNASKYTVYNTAGSADTSDDSISNFSDNELAHTPKIMSRVSADYKYNSLLASLSIRTMGKRFGNAENSFVLPAFTTLGLSAEININKNVLLGFRVTNLLNSAGLMNFFGPNEFGSSANAATKEYINANPSSSFVVFPILPRAIYLSVGYKI